MVPDQATCLSLLTKAGCDQRIVDHVRAVHRLAVALADHAPTADRPLIEAGALLHDIGRAFDNGPDHVPRGVTFLREQGVDEAVVGIVARHMGAGITDVERQILGWPEGTYVPQTLEERIVCHADNLTFGVEHRTLEAVIEKLRRRQLEATVDAMRALHHKLRTELGIDPDDVSRALT